MSVYSQQRKLAIQEFLGSSDFLIAGTRAWYGNGIRLGQTVKHCITTVYNKSIDGIFFLDGMPVKFKFVRTDYPEQASKEFWVIDMLNNMAALDISHREAVLNLKRCIQESQFNVPKLFAECDHFGNEQAKIILNKAAS
jgi:hypothetical protein